ncbi:MAG TPA: Yip1 family protein [Bacillota bacterium]|jgi:hypothetical protein|nr:Yip1 family protein [Peptococcaceae bacterium MAG4]NLW37681.1 YIP1 family protein [Peptococcaceae bacterium]HPZ42748.1 Yip1 family protein [Bacillota bacterium]HQD75461.1 Yip1 family protein [Bacillota bacterium]HUM59101.1 Yip1 family protein [Bacillota bacterium]
MNEEVLREEAGRRNNPAGTGLPPDFSGPEQEQGQSFAAGGAEHLPAGTGQEDGEEPGPGFLELVYGVFFEPRSTMQKVAHRPPLGQAVLLVTILNLLGTGAWFVAAARVLERELNVTSLGLFGPSLQALLPLGAVTVFLWGYFKWFAYSALLSLAAEVLGGLGSARGVMAASGLASLPAVLLVPVQLLTFGAGSESLAVNMFSGLAGLAVAIWILVLNTIGVREVHSLSTGRSLLAVLSPYLALVAFLILLLVALVIAAASLPSHVPLWDYF